MSFPKKRDNKGRAAKENVGDLAGTYMSYLRHKAKVRNLVWELSKEYLWDLFLQQNGRCALSQVPIFISNDIDKNKNIVRKNHTASLDRIDNKIGYIKGNVQWVHKQVNRIRRELSVDEFVDWCHLIHHANPERNSVNEIKVTENVQRLESEDSTDKLSTSVRPFGPNMEYPIPWKTLFKTEGDDIV